MSAEKVSTTLEEVRARFRSERGVWADNFERMAEIHPDFVEAYLDYSLVPWRRGALDPKVRELVYFAIDISTTHLHSVGARVHLRNAVRLGAGPEELMDVAELAVASGFHTMTLGCRTLIRVLEARGERVPVVDEQKQTEVRHRYLSEIGFFPEEIDSVLRVDAEIVDAFRKLAFGPDRRRNLDGKTIELIRLALDVATTQLHEDGVRLHIERALDHGATPDEIIEVLELSSVLGIHGSALGAAAIGDGGS